MNFYHIINPYKVDDSSDAYQEQKMTLESLFEAINYVDDSTTVNIVMKVSQEDFDYFASSYGDDKRVKLLKLKTDSSELQPPFNVVRKLPLLNDLLDLTELSDTIHDEDLIVATNMDICVQPFFYTELKRLNNTGRDIFVVNRRTIPKELIKKDLIDAYISEGDQHIGHDCFVFPYEALKKFDLREHILGIGFVFRPFLLNCILHAKRFDELDNAYLTFHYGDDMLWKNEKFSDYLEHNKQKLIEVYKANFDLIEQARKNSDKKLWIEKFFNFAFLE
ncbi:hypothetical protein Q4561_12655 [Alteromonas sp. 1_MG-2023]|uniref:hypothetical protein n=1 Tax=Alteromonas sp. 1_MG-2023 TaxID=3062669 RepID=UPI0026E1F610|nr:hypothetical protein [Alteromonas sp. 1_MG-2023]MDO6567914.1 hypothetical protein [Alteromonas sp. 1_MG-2023]